MESRPHNLGEWADYIKQFSGKALFSKAVASNTQTFARALVAEGMTMGDVEQIMLLFVRQLRATGTKVPEGGPFDLINMALTDPVARKGPTMSEEQAEMMEALGVEPTIDDYDQFELEVGFAG